MVEQILGTLIGRWYVTLLILIYLFLAVRYLGAKRTAIYTAIAFFVAALTENLSVHTGFPYTGTRFRVPGDRSDRR